MIRVVVADDQEMVRVGFSMMLEASGEVEVVARCADGLQALAAIETTAPDVALLDIRMPGLTGIEVARRVAGRCVVVIVTTFGQDDYVDEALAAGALGFLVKDSSPELLLAAVRSAASGDGLVSPALLLPLLARRTASRQVALPLSGRELEVARLVASGESNAGIASGLGVSLSTVKTHVANIQARLGARNRVDIAAAVWRNGLMG